MLNANTCGCTPRIVLHLANARQAFKYCWTPTPSTSHLWTGSLGIMEVIVQQSKEVEVARFLCSMFPRRWKTAYSPVTRGEGSRMITGWSRGDRGLPDSCCSRLAGRNMGAWVLVRTGTLCERPGCALWSPSPCAEKNWRVWMNSVSLNPKLSFPDILKGAMQRN